MVCRWWIIGVVLLLFAPLADAGGDEPVQASSNSTAAGALEPIAGGSAEVREPSPVEEPSRDLTVEVPTARRPAIVFGAEQEHWSAGDVATSAIVAWLVVSAIYLAIGTRQTKEAGGTLLRLAWVAPLAAAVSLMPLGAWILSAPFASLDAQAVLAFIVTYFSCVWVSLWMRSPLVKPSRPALPLVLDEEVDSSIARIAAAMKITAPRLRRKPLLGGSAKIAAWAGGLPQPSLIVTDGALTRLAPAERDAILAHEMGHIANHSLWPLSALFSITCAVAVWAGHDHSIPVALLLASLFGVGFRRIVSRTIEADCDRRAARATSFPQMISALYKVHAAHELRNRGWWSLIAFAVATHPSREVRLSLLIRAFRREGNRSTPSVARPEDGSPALAETGGAAFAYSPRRFWIHRITSCVAALVWAVVLATAWRAGEKAPIGILLFLIAAPSIVMPTAIKPEVRRNAKRARPHGTRSWAGLCKLGLLCFAIAVACVALVSLIDLNQPLVQVGGAACLVLAFIAWMAYRRTSSRAQFYRALNDHDFARARRIGYDRERLRKDPVVRYMLALLEVIAGNNEYGICELEELTRKYPKFRLPPMALNSALLEIGQIERALQVASAASLQSPKDPLPHAKVARALRLLGRHDEARAAAIRALELDPDNELAEAVLASVALDARALEEAQRRVARSLDLSPSNFIGLIVQAEILLASGDLSAAENGVKVAATAIRVEPFALLNRELAVLERRLAELRTQASSSTVGTAENLRAFDVSSP